MIEKLPYISALNAAVIAISSDGWPTWSAAHSEDTFFQRIHERLLILMSYYNQPTITAVCQYMVAEDLVPEAQSVPAGKFWPYKLAARFTDDRGVIQKRVPASIAQPTSGAVHGAPGSHRWGTREIFKKCTTCLLLQPLDYGWDDKLEGPMTRESWYNEAESSGLFWVNYFNKHTLDWMYGPGKPNKWPFNFSTPPWCVADQYNWRLSAYDWSEYADLNIVYYPEPGGSYGTGIKIYMRIRPDLESENPGNMEVGRLYSSHASMDEDYEVSGDYSHLTVDPLPSLWTALDLSVVQHADDPWLYQIINFLEMDGDYIISLFVSSDLNFDMPYDLYSEEMGGEWY